MRLLDCTANPALALRATPGISRCILAPAHDEIEARLRLSLPKAIQREREARAMTQEQLAEKAGLDPQARGLKYFTSAR